MTNYRESFCIHDAIAHSLDKTSGLGPKVATSVISKSDSTLRKLGDPNNDLYNIQFEQAAKLAAAHRVRGIEERYSAAFENLIKDNMAAMGSAPVTVGAEDMHRRMMKIMSAIGETADELERSTAANSPNGENLTEGEKRDLLDDVRKLQASVDRLLQDIQSAPTGNVRKMTGHARSAS
ncbi:MAG: hypothetical protein CL843_19655 [Crocinitomicaceae bacterium]|nr:hypothetical protein [Crocinitomicaceae bacterium]